MSFGNMNEDRLDADEMGTSDCCDAPIIHGDICSFCKEHCECVPDEPTEAQLDRLAEPKAPEVIYNRHNCP